MYRDGRGVPQDSGEALTWFRKAAGQSHLYAISDLGKMYEKGEGVPVDRAEAGRWYRRAADAAFAVPDEDFAEWDPWAVVDIFQEAAAYGHARAQQHNVDYYLHMAADPTFRSLRAHYQSKLGDLYSRGQWDYVQAHMWFNLAASISTGDDQTKYSAARDAVAAKMTHNQIAEAQRLAREWKPTSEDEA
jgi:TPR repeat protein